MDRFAVLLEDVLENMHQSAVKLEKQMFGRHEELPLTASEIHLIACVGELNSEGRTISGVAKALSISLSSATIAINKLEKKGFIQKEKKAGDGRMVYVYLTREGEKAGRYHRFCRRHFFSRLSGILTKKEKACLETILHKVDAYLAKI